MKNKLLSILFWSVISAAFIGPGTVTTAAAAGAGFGMQLLWALIFSILGCLVLQEAAARVTISTGKSLGQAISSIYKSRSFLKWAILVAIITGGAAYQAGNILGAVSGVELEFAIDPKIATLLISGLGITLLWFGRVNTVANLMGIVVAIMGVAFITVASSLLTSGNFEEINTGMTLPKGSEVFIIGLVGTTIVPYNLFLASGISKGQNINQMRWGLIPAILIGGLISIAIMIVGTMVQENFSFQGLAEALESGSGVWARKMLGIGLFAAGFTSSITAPLATAVTGKSLMGETWKEGTIPYRISWGLVIASGLIFGISGIKPIPVIIMAQAFNGLLLPGITILLIIILNHPSVMPKEKLNSRLSNIFLFFILYVTLFLGLNNISRVITQQYNSMKGYIIILLISLFILAMVIDYIRQLRRKSA